MVQEKLEGLCENPSDNIVTATDDVNRSTDATTHASSIIISSASISTEKWKRNKRLNPSVIKKKKT